MTEPGRWLGVPTEALVDGPAGPHLITTRQVPGVRDRLMADGAMWVDADVRDAAHSGHVVDALKSVLPFPDWCGSGWDSIDDAFQELRALWPFPLVIAVQGLDALLARRPRVGLQTVIRFDDLSGALSRVGAQLMVLYPADRWGLPVRTDTGPR